MSSFLEREKGMKQNVYKNAATARCALYIPRIYRKERECFVGISYAQLYHFIDSLLTTRYVETKIWKKLGNESVIVLV